MGAAQVQTHPEFAHVFWDLKPDRAGRVAVADGRGGPFRISFEVHGTGPVKLLWLMGLGSLKRQWQRQTRDLGHAQALKYSCLILDNRGMGDSDKPRLRYSTSAMARDALEVVDHVGWTDARQLHVVGISMGGMIAQELAMLAPDRIASLNLVSTAPYIFNTIGYVENLRNRINLLIPKSMDKQIANVGHNCCTEKWLAAPDDCEYVKAPFPTNADRFAATEVTKRLNTQWFTRTGFVLQLIAAGWHHKSPEQLRELADRVGRERIMVVHGTADRMVTFPHGEKLLECLGGEQGGVTKHFIEGQSHVIPMEMRTEFNGWIEQMVDKCETLNKS